MALPLGIRGSNPIWAEFDLAGNIFDDTYYMWVLENEIPYIPAVVYHDPDLMVPWGNPIQFLGNGTLPNDIFFEPGVVYRLEFRQHLGLGAPTQNDPLIYLVENYIAVGNGDFPGNDSFATNNQISNPQFATFDLPNPFTFTGTDPDLIWIGGGWFLLLAGTGTVTITQVPLDSTTPNPSNAPYALEINLTGWTDNSAFLVQRFQQNGLLWANKTVSSAITARVQGSNAVITAILADSMNATLGDGPLLSTTVNNEFNQYTGHTKLSASTDTDTPPAAFIDYRLALPSDVDIFITSIQVIAQDTNAEPAFQQDSINRQIDHLYHLAYPVVPIGTIIDHFGFAETLPHYIICHAQEVSRTGVTEQLFNVLTKVENVVLSLGMTTFTVANGAIYAAGRPLESTGITPGTLIASISGNTITMDAPAIGNGATDVRFFTTGVGDGSTTFNVPDLFGITLAGAGGTLFTSKGAGTVGGAASITLNGGADLAAGAGFSATFTNVQPTMLAWKYIRFE